VCVYQCEFCAIGKLHTFYSADTLALEENEHLFPIEFLNEQNPSGMPPHKLDLKKGAIILVMRNLDYFRELCNGTRLIIEELGRYTITARYISGRFAGHLVCIPRITLRPLKTQFDPPYTLNRRQFPIRAAFAMTINKSQGQTLKIIGCYLPEPVFSHGQLYVVCSRGGNPQYISFFIDNARFQGVFDGHEGVYTRNVVYTEALL